MSDEAHKWRTNEIEMLQAQVKERDKLVAHLENKNDNLNGRNKNLVEKSHRESVQRHNMELQRSNQNLVEKNNNQVEIIADKNLTINSLNHQLNKKVGQLEGYKNGNDALNRIVAEQALVIEANRGEIAGLENRLGDSLVSYETAAKQRAEFKADVKVLHASIDDLEQRLVYAEAGKQRLKQTNLEHTMKNVSASEMVGKIIDAIQGAGYPTGWGDDEQLAELEAVSSTITDQATELAAMLDNIRTER